MNRLFHIANKLTKKGHVRIGRIVSMVDQIVNSHSIQSGVEVGEGTIFLHHGLGCAINSGVKIGKGCTICQNVTIGEKFSNNIDMHQYPSIGDGCLIGCGSVILGNIRIGNNVIVGANSVVLNDVEDNVVCAGIPAKTIKKRSTEV